MVVHKLIIESDPELKLTIRVMIRVIIRVRMKVMLTTEAIGGKKIKREENLHFHKFIIFHKFDP